MVRVRSFGNMSQGPSDNGKVKTAFKSKPKVKIKVIFKIARVVIRQLESR